MSTLRQILAKKMENKNREGLLTQPVLFLKSLYYEYIGIGATITIP